MQHHSAAPDFPQYVRAEWGAHEEVANDFGIYQGQEILRDMAIAKVKQSFPYMEMEHLRSRLSYGNVRPVTPDPRAKAMSKRAWENLYVTWKYGVLNAKYVRGPLFLQMSSNGVDYVPEELAWRAS